MKYLKDIENCRLCEWRCGVDRLAGETGICRMTLPQVASCTLHPAPPRSYTVFTAGCDFKCLNCQNWSIAHYPDNGEFVRGWVDPKDLALECIYELRTSTAKAMGADRIFFSGGEPTIHLPYVEEVIREARKFNPDTKVNFDTNGFLTKDSFRRVLNFTTSITFDIKAYSDEAHRALTGAPVEPVLRNAEELGKNREKLWEYRVLVIPGITDEEVGAISEFIASIDPSLPVCFLSFRPNFVLENHPYANRRLMNRCVETAKKFGLENVYWSGSIGKEEKIRAGKRVREYKLDHARLAGSYALLAKCATHPRDCGGCKSNQKCPLKRHIPQIIT
ncbi:MAG: radical SAM protein [Candidatus Geothermarchaeales archaeon]